MHGMYPPILGYFFPSGKKDFLKLIPKWNKKEKVWAVKHQSSECGRSQLEFSVHLPSTDIATRGGGGGKAKKGVYCGDVKGIVFKQFTHG